MQKLHIAPLAFKLSRVKQRAFKSVNQTHYAQFDSNSITIRPILDSKYPKGDITDILDKFKVSLRKYRIKPLRKLHLHFHGWAGLDAIALRNLALEIATHFKDLQELRVQFFICDKLTGYGIEHFLRPLTEQFNALKKLSISINCCENVGDDALYNIASLVICNSKALEKLSLNFSGILTELNSGELLPFDPDIMNRTQKYGTSLLEQNYFRQGNMTAKGVEFLNKKITQYLSQNLQQFSLISPLDPHEDFLHNQMIGLPRPPISAHTINSNKVNKKMLQDLKNLRGLHLRFETFIDMPCHIEEGLLISLTSAIGQNMCKLQYLSLDFAGFHELTNKNLNEIASNIFPRLNQLRGLSFNYEGEICAITDQTLLSLTKELSNHAKNLEELSFCCESDFTLTNQGMKHLVRFVSQNFVLLKRLKLGFESAQFDIGEDLLSQHTYQSLEHLCLCISEPKFGIKNQFANLKQLILMFYKCSNMTDSDFQKIIRSAFNCSVTGLQELALTFKRCPLISSKGFEVFHSETWPSLEKLETFKLELTDCKKIDQESLEKVTSFVQTNLKSMQNLSLTFKDGQQLKGLAATSFINNILRISLAKLQALHLDLLKEHDQLNSAALFETLIDNINNSCLKNLRALTLIFGFVNQARNDKNAGVIRSVIENLSFIPQLTIY